MKLKYYLRGIAAGVLLSTCVLTIFHSMDKTSQASQTMTEDEIVSAAKNLGMIFPKDGETQNATTPGAAETQQTTASDSTSAQDSPAQDSQTENVPKATQVPVQTQTPENITQVSGEEAKDAQEDINKTAQDILSNAQQDLEEAFQTEITIKRGMNSYAVAQQLQKAGIIDNAADFDSYITRNGYDKKLNVGKYKIDSDATYEQIANKLTGK